MFDIMPMFNSSNSSTVKHTACGVTLHKNIFESALTPI